MRDRKPQGAATATARAWLGQVQLTYVQSSSQRLLRPCRAVWIPILLQHLQPTFHKLGQGGRMGVGDFLHRQNAEV